MKIQATEQVTEQVTAGVDEDLSDRFWIDFGMNSEKEQNRFGKASGKLQASFRKELKVWAVGFGMMFHSSIIRLNLINAK